MKNKKIAIIILNWNGWRDTIECLESLQNITYSNYNTYLVDNFSSDESIINIQKWIRKNKIPNKEYTKAKWNKSSLNNTELNKNKIIFIKNDENKGFAAGNNLAIKKIVDNNLSETILLLNNDTIVEPNFLNLLMSRIMKEKKIGIVGPKTYYYHNKITLQSCGGKVNFWFGKYPLIGNGELDKKQYNISKDVDYIMGSCLLIKNDVIKKIGLIEEKYFLYTEEIDWCLKAKKEGYKVVFENKSKIWHKSQSSTKKISEMSEFYKTRNDILLQRKFSRIIQKLFFYIYYHIYRMPKTIIKLILFRKYSLKKYLEAVQEGFK